MNATVYIATSLDGFIARENGGLDWLHAVESAPGGEDYGYRAFMETVDAIVMGRNTYDKVQTFDKWPYDKPAVVLTNRPLAIPAALAGSIEATAGPPGDILARLSARGMQHAYVDGGKTVQDFLEAGLIQRLIITRIPVIIGRGIPLFGPVSRDIPLSHIETRQYPNGLIQSDYRIRLKDEG